MKITLPNGLVVEGTPDQVAQVAASQGYPGSVRHDEKVWHYSESKKMWVEISSMDTSWLRNSIMKILRAWWTEVETAKSPREFVSLIVNVNNTHLAALLKELSKKWTW